MPALTVVEYPASNFYKEEGGKSNVMRFVVASPVSLSTSVTIEASLLYDDGSVVEDQGETLNLITRPEEMVIGPDQEELVVEFRIEKVSRRKEGKSFVLQLKPVYPSASSSSSSSLLPPPEERLTAALSKPIAVFSKRKLEERQVTRRANPIYAAQFGPPTIPPREHTGQSTGSSHHHNHAHHNTNAAAAAGGAGNAAATGGRKLLVEAPPDDGAASFKVLHGTLLQMQNKQDRIEANTKRTANAITCVMQALQEILLVLQNPHAALHMMQAREAMLAGAGLSRGPSSSAGGGLGGIGGIGGLGGVGMWGTELGASGSNLTASLAAGAAGNAAVNASSSGSSSNAAGNGGGPLTTWSFNSLAPPPSTTTKPTATTTTDAPPSLGGGASAAKKGDAGKKGAALSGSKRKRGAAHNDNDSGAGDDDEDHNGQTLTGNIEIMNGIPIRNALLPSLLSTNSFGGSSSSSSNAGPGLGDPNSLLMMPGTNPSLGRLFSMGTDSLNKLTASVSSSGMGMGMGMGGLGSMGSGSLVPPGFNPSLIRSGLSFAGMPSGLPLLEASGSITGDSASSSSSAAAGLISSATGGQLGTRFVSSTDMFASQEMLLGPAGGFNLSAVSSGGLGQLLSAAGLGATASASSTANKPAAGAPSASAAAPAKPATAASPAPAAAAAAAPPAVKRSKA